MRTAERDECCDERCETHGDGAEEEAVVWVVDHDGPDFGVESVAEDGDYGEDGEDYEVEDEEDDGEPVEAGELEGDVDEEERDDSSAHCYAEPWGC